MTPFSLKIVTPDGIVYDAPAEELVVRTVSGNLGVLAGHMDCVSPLRVGAARIRSGGKIRHAACSGGMLRVSGGNVTLISRAFEWK